jgi:hypothetical protein
MSQILISGMSALRRRTPLLVLEDSRLRKRCVTILARQLAPGDATQKTRPKAGS